MRPIENEYDAKKKSLQDALSNVSFVAATANLWNCKNRSSLGVICRWIDKDSLERKMSMLSCKRLKRAHT